MPAMRKLFSGRHRRATLALCTVAMAEPMDEEEISQKCVNCHGGDAHGKRFKGDKRAGRQPSLVSKGIPRAQLRNFRDHVAVELRMYRHRMRPWHECSTMK